MLLAGDCLERLKELPDCSVDSVVTDPPYHLTSIVKRFGAAAASPAKDYTGARENATGAYARASRGFMGQQWDGGDIAFRVELWAQVLRVLKPGGHVVAFSATRTYHRMACAIEDAGFEIRDQLAWMYGTGFPKSLNVGRALQAQASAGGCGPEAQRRAAMGDDYRPSGRGRVNYDHGSGSARNGAADGDALQWQGWGTALKPAWEPICLARKPISARNVAENVLAHGVGGLNIDGCRIEAVDEIKPRGTSKIDTDVNPGWLRPHMQDRALMAAREAAAIERANTLGRWPANIIHDGSPEVVGAFPAEAGAFAPVRGTEPSNAITNVYGERVRVATTHHGDTGSAARFFYSAKAARNDRIGSKHPTVKPVDLMRWLVRLVTPPRGTVLDPFAGSGTTGEAALLEGFKAIMVEREPEYQADIARRMALVFAGETERAHAIVKARGEEESHDTLPLFGGGA